MEGSSHYPISYSISAFTWSDWIKQRKPVMIAVDNKRENTIGITIFLFCDYFEILLAMIIRVIRYILYFNREMYQVFLYISSLLHSEHWIMALSLHFK
jgi:hypothetical protein